MLVHCMEIENQALRKSLGNCREVSVRKPTFLWHKSELAPEARGTIDLNSGWPHLVLTLY